MTPLELEQCVLLAFDVTAGPNHFAATKALQECNVDPATLISLIQSTRHESVFFYCLTCIPKCDSMSESQKIQLWQFLLRHQEFLAPHVRTKMAVILAHLLLITQPASSWTRMFASLQQEAPPDLYCKTLIALQEHDNFDSSGIKDFMRGYQHITNGNNNGRQQELSRQLQPPQDTIVSQLLETLLSHVYNGNNSAANDESLLTLFFAVLQHFASWIDMSLLIQPQVMNLVFESLSRTDSGVAAVQFLQEVVGRGMPVQDKVTLLQELQLLDKIHARVDLVTVDASPIEVVIQVAQLVNDIGLEIVQEESSSSLLWPQVMELFFQCFSYDGIDVTAAVLPLANVLATRPEYTSQLLSIMYEQLKYPVDYTFDYQDDDEAEEEVFRSELRKLYQTLIRSFPSEALQFVCEQVWSKLPTPLSTCPFSEMEAALRLVHHYCEGIRPPPGLTRVMKNDVFVNLLTALHKSDIGNHDHVQVLLLYYDLSVRYYPIFLTEPSLLPPLLQGLSGERGLQHVNARVRSRSSYLLLRLVKSVIQVMQPYVETAVTGIQGLLIHPTLQQQQQQLRPDDALYLFETMGLLLGKTGLPPEQQQTSLTKVIAPHIVAMNQVLRDESLSSNPDNCGDVLASSVAAIAYLSKGFKNPPQQVQMVLAETVPVTLAVLQALPEHELVRSKILVYLQRMIQCIGVQVLPTMSQFLSLLIQHITTDDILDVAQLLNQLCIKFRTKAISCIDPVLLLFLRKCHELVPAAEHVVTSNEAIIPPHLRTEQLSIQKLSFAVLQHVVTYGLSPILVSPTNVASLELVLQTMSEAAIHVQDAVMKRTCLTFFRELIDQWIQNDTDICPINDIVRNGFVRFVLETFVPGMFQCFSSPSFNHEDALQARNVSEFATILYLLKSRTRGNEFEQYVVRGALTACPPQVIEGLRQVATRQEMNVWLKQTIQTLKQPC